MVFNATIRVDRPVAAVWNVFAEPATWEVWWGGKLKSVSPRWQTGAELSWQYGPPSRVADCILGKRVTLIDAADTRTTFLFEESSANQTALTYEEDYSKARVSVSDPARRRAECQATVSKLKLYVESRSAAEGQSQPLVHSSSGTKEPGILLSIVIALSMVGGLGIAALAGLIAILFLGFAPGEFHSDGTQAATVAFVALPFGLLGLWANRKRSILAEMFRRAPRGAAPVRDASAGAAAVLRTAGDKVALAKRIADELAGDMMTIMLKRHIGQDVSGDIEAIVARYKSEEERALARDLCRRSMSAQL